MNLHDCSYYRCRRAGDETLEWCELSDHPCMVAYGYDCEDCVEWNEIKGVNNEKVED